MTSINAALADEGPDARHLRRALALARRALGGVSPRAPVGAVIVSGGTAAGAGTTGEIVGEGATQPLPGDHAEVVALKKAGDRARGATLYCTLEPHAHQASVPPCTEAIISAGMRRVVCAMRDPNPKVDGAGYRRLREAGIEVGTDVPAAIAREAAEILEGFVTHLRTGRPLVTAKYAMTLDGKTATRTGASKWITGDQARARAHELRAAADAVVVGIGTVLADDPRLTARVPWAKALEGPRPRLRVVVDSEGRMPASATMLREPGKVLHVVASGDTATGLVGAAKRTPDGGGANRAVVETIRLPTNPAPHVRVEKLAGGRVDLAALVDELGRRGVANVLVEGGATLLGGFFDAGLVDKVVVFVAPRIFGGQTAPGAIGGTGIEVPDQATTLERVRFEPVGQDFMLTGYMAGKG